MSETYGDLVRHVVAMLDWTGELEAAAKPLAAARDPHGPYLWEMLAELRAVLAKKPERAQG